MGLGPRSPSADESNGAGSGRTSDHPQRLVHCERGREEKVCQQVCGGHQRGRIVQVMIMACVCDRGITLKTSPEVNPVIFLWLFVHIEHL